MKSLTSYIYEALAQINGFCILKPEFLEHEYEFYELLKNNNWQLIQKNKKTLSKKEAEDLYINLKDKPFYDELTTYMASDECICCACYKDCKDPIVDMKKLKDKVRKTWGKDEMKNAMHSSGSLKDVNREYKLIFENKLVD
jgi:nucleoside-diphosphate kinase